jgi:hypothetical protein
MSPGLAAKGYEKRIRACHLPQHTQAQDGTGKYRSRRGRNWPGLLLYHVCRGVLRLSNLSLTVGKEAAGQDQDDKVG